MNKEVLFELANRWDRDAQFLKEKPQKVAEGPADERHSGRVQGVCETKEDCADALRTLISLLGGEGNE